MANNPDMKAQFPVALNISISEAMDAHIREQVKARGVSKSVVVRELMDAGFKAKYVNFTPRWVDGVPL